MPHCHTHYSRRLARCVHTHIKTELKHVPKGISCSLFISPAVRKSERFTSRANFSSRQPGPTARLTVEAVLLARLFQSAVCATQLSHFLFDFPISIFAAEPSEKGREKHLRLT